MKCVRGLDEVTNVEVDFMHEVGEFLALELLRLKRDLDEGQGRG